MSEQKREVLTPEEIEIIRLYRAQASQEADRIANERGYKLYARVAALRSRTLGEP